jgi:hypothetical protein
MVRALRSSIIDSNGIGDHLPSLEWQIRRLQQELPTAYVQLTSRPARGEAGEETIQHFAPRASGAKLRTYPILPVVRWWQSLVSTRLFETTQCLLGPIYSRLDTYRSC